MKVKGFYQFEKNGETKTCRAQFESTGIRLENGKVLWQKIKDGKLVNRFAEQFNPDMPWANGKWFLKLDTDAVLKEHPELRVAE